MVRRVFSLRLWGERRREARRERGRRFFAEGRSLLAGQKPGAAAKLLRRAYRRLPEDQTIGFELARAEAARGRATAAATRLKTLVEDSPNNLEALALLLELQQSTNDVEGQRTTLAQWLEADPGHLPSLRSLREVYRKEGRWSEALRVQEKLVARVEGRKERGLERRVRSELLVSCVHGLSPSEAPALLQRAVAEDPSYAPAHLVLGDALKGQGDLEGAYRAWLRGYEATGLVGLLLRMEELRVQQNRADEMLKFYRKLGGKTEAAALLRARLLLSLDRAEEALELLETLEASRASQWLLGEALLRLRSFERAARALRNSAGGGGPSLALSCSVCKSASQEWGPCCPACGASSSLGVDLARLPQSVPA